MKKNKSTTAPTATGKNDVKQVIKRKKQLFLLFYTTQNSRGDSFMYHAAKTRRQNIEKSSWYNKNIHLIFNVPIQDIAEVVTTIPQSIQKRGGVGQIEVKEVSVFSHSWFDGPVGSLPSSIAPVLGNQMKINGGWDSIDYHWAVRGRFVAYGCQPGTDKAKKRISVKELSESSKFKDVHVWGQPSPTWPSLYPDMRETTIYRNLDVGWAFDECYMVASVYGKGLAATRYIPLDRPQANKSKKYVNGILVLRSYQDAFNFHD